MRSAKKKKLSEDGAIEFPVKKKKLSEDQEKAVNVEIIETKLPPKDPMTAWRDADGALHLAKFDFLELSTARNKFLNSRTLAANKRLQADKLETTTVMKIEALRREAQSIDQQAENARHLYEIKAKGVWEKYGLQSKQVGWDDDTGKITVL